MGTYKMLYLAKANSVIAQKGEMFEIDELHTRITSKKSGMSVPMQMIREFDKHFTTFADPKIFRVSGKDVVVGADALSFDGKICPVDAFCHFVKVFGSDRRFTVSMATFYGVEMTLARAQEIAQYIELLEELRQDGASIQVNLKR
ncbi:MAG: hypothetical protein IT190_08050 [Microbacteriaceae bacterium]|nr:hypothetical protein [Microbacteriaceae bacterium]